MVERSSIETWFGPLPTWLALILFVAFALYAITKSFLELWPRLDNGREFVQWWMQRRGASVTTALHPETRFRWVGWIWNSVGLVIIALLLLNVVWLYGRSGEPLALYIGAPPQHIEFTDDVYVVYPLMHLGNHSSVPHTATFDSTAVVEFANGNRESIELVKTLQKTLLVLDPMNPRNVKSKLSIHTEDLLTTRSGSPIGVNRAVHGAVVMRSRRRLDFTDALFEFSYRDGSGTLRVLRTERLDGPPQDLGTVP